MARQEPNAWKGPRLSLFKTLISHTQAEEIGKAGGIALNDTIEWKLPTGEVDGEVVRTATKLDYLQKHLNSLAQHYEFKSTKQTGPTHAKTVKALGEIRKTATKLRSKMGLSEGVTPDDAWDKLPPAIYHELTIPARQLASNSKRRLKEPIFTADTVLRRALSGFLTLLLLIESAHDGAQRWDEADTTDDTAADWLILELWKIYEHVSGRKAGVTIHRDGEAGGPFIRFAVEAFQCMGLKHMTTHGAASRFRRAKKRAKNEQSHTSSRIGKAGK